MLPLVRVAIRRRMRVQMKAEVLKVAGESLLDAIDDGHGGRERKRRRVTRSRVIKVQHIT